jgi:hypothetical protein
LKETGKLDPHEGRVKIDTIAALYLDDRKGAAPKSYSWLTQVWNKTFLWRLSSIADHHGETHSVPQRKA